MLETAVLLLNDEEHGKLHLHPEAWVKEHNPFPKPPRKVLIAEHAPEKEGEARTKPGAKQVASSTWILVLLHRLDSSIVGMCDRAD